MGIRGMKWSVVLLLALVNLPTWGEEKTENGTPKAEAKETPTETPEDVDLYDVPKSTDVDELHAYLKKLIAYRPARPKDALTHRKKAPDAAFLAADRIVSFGKDKSSAAYRLAYPIYISRKLSGLSLKSTAEQKKTLDDVIEFVGSGKIGREEYVLMSRVARAFEADENEELAVAANQAFAEILSKSDEPQLRDVGQRFAGSVRRLKLVGQGMDVKGTDFAGEKFTLASLKGKVVLIDFWATWCGPCLGEIPNMRRMYEAYHDKGFEIVGLSVDEDRQALDSFLEKEKLPWIILHDEMGKNPALIEYGVMGYPTMFLMGADGKVVSTHARGPELVRLLEKLLGPVEEKEVKKEVKEDAK